MTEKIQTADLFKGNPYLEVFGDQVDQFLHGSGTPNPKVETIIKMAELHEQRTANKLEFYGQSRNAAQKEDLSSRLGIQERKPSGLTRA